ncbi:MAG: bifunctional phosphoribosyl-AMP cyclohydrolase/phosphoribosyl-ATP diphosphatase HisIE [Clostridia bacterium]|nr:bifunctional phosphoribosyl-AMP cyclohydrolase/phosphoribosyl-ATP diphosphatase HisIE [Clostridia bacterium]
MEFKLKFSDTGLVPAIIQDAATGKVLMMAYMNEESLKLTISTGETHFYSRSRQELWHKGATSGHVQRVKEAYYDCDGDTLLFLVEQEGVACHTGAMSCFHNQFIKPIGEGTDLPEANPASKMHVSQAEDSLGTILEQVFQVIKSRQEELPEGSYTTYLFQKGQDKILKKVAEEAGEVLIGSKNNNNNEVVYEAADLIYHLMVLLAYHGLTLSDIQGELAKRR